MFPLEKYRFYTDNIKVIAVSTYAGKTVRGIAKCAPGDVFDLEKGKRIAAARCAAKIAEKRVLRAERKIDEACEDVDQAKRHLYKMDRYVVDAHKARNMAYKHLADLLND